MKNVWVIGQIIFLILAISSLILKNGMTNEYMILSFEMAILYKLESES
jgi:hypothetical protein